MRRLCILPLAITSEDAITRCVAGLDLLGNWVRPQPIPLSSVESPNGAFGYDHWSEILVRDAPSARRPEDVQLAAEPRRGDAVAMASRAVLVRRHRAETVDAAFADGRSAAVVSATAEHIYARLHTRGRVFLRLVFRDATGERFDWILPEIATNARFLGARVGDGIDSGAVAAFLDELAAADLHLAIGLTLAASPSHDRFRGCHPLVVGVHALPIPSTPR